MGLRRRSREYAVQLLFQIDLSAGEADEALANFWSEHEAPDDVRAFTERLVRGACARRDDLDRRIATCARHWRLERMAVVDRNVLRMAVYELLEERGTPAAVIIDEAIEIARKFGGGDSASFINGVLDSIRSSIELDDAAGSRAK